MSSTERPDHLLSSQAVLTAVEALCGPDRPAAETLLKGFRRLVVSAHWTLEMAHLERVGLVAQCFNGRFADLVNLPGDLILLRAPEQGLVLLQRLEQRWLPLGEEGLPHPDPLDMGEDESVEAVMLKIPASSAKTGRFSSLALLWMELRAAWAEVGLASLFVNTGQLLLPLFALLIYDKIALNGLFETLWALVVGMALYLVTDAGMRLVRSWTTERISVDLSKRSDETLWTKLVAQVELPPGGFARFLSNYRDLTLSRDFVSSSYLLSIADIPFLGLYLAVIGMISWPLMVAAIVLVLLFSAVGYLLQMRQARLSKEAEQENTRKLAYMGETLGSLDVVRTSPGSGVFLRSWRELTGQSTERDAAKRLSAQHLGMLSATLQTVTTVVILTAGVYLIYAQLLSVGKLIACNLLANRAMAQVASFFAVISKRQDFMRAAERMEECLADVDERQCTPRPKIDGNLSIIGVGKYYEGRPAALENVSFASAPGERIALMGRPGAGKSTLLRCLSGLCATDSGQILIDGLDLEDISRFDRVKWLAYKGQDPVVFAATLEENLRISGCADAERLQEAIWASGLETEFSSGRMSLGMQLEERGANLSGGQRQKVALARVFAQSSQILLLDEPTLGLDPESERQLAARLPKLLGASTSLIMTTHSPIMLEIVQRIIALDAGRVVADGPREKLVTLPSVKKTGS